MSEHQHVLVVAPHADIADGLIALLAPQLSLTVVSSYEEARQHLQRGDTYLLITELKLGPYNGLQLALLLRDGGESARAIVIGDRDAAWEREARQFGVAYIDRMADKGDMLRLVSALLESGAQSSEPAS